MAKLIERGGFSTLLVDGLATFSQAVLKAVNQHHEKTQKQCLAECEAIATNLFLTCRCATPAASVYTPGMLSPFPDPSLRGGTVGCYLACHSSMIRRSQQPCVLSSRGVKFTCVMKQCEATEHPRLSILVTLW